MVSPKPLETRIVSCPARVKFAAVFMIAAAAFLTREVSGYALEGPKWASSPVMRLSLGNAGRVLIDGNTSWNHAAAPALDMWNQVIKRIQLGRVFTPRREPHQRDGLNSIALSDMVYGDTWPPSALAVTVLWSSGATITEADVLFNSGRNWDSYRGPLRFTGTGQLIADIQRVALHELGHVIGLDHPDEYAQIMDAIMNSTIWDRYTLSGDDIIGAQHLYATPSKAIFLAQNRSTGQRIIWAGDGGTFFRLYDLGTVPTQWNIVASADFNGSGIVDIVWQNSSTRQCVVWFMRWIDWWPTQVGGAVLPTLPPNWEIATAADFNGDRKPDLVLQNMVTRQRVIWFMNGATRTSSWSLGVVGSAWKITGSGDFNGDGKADILWQNNMTGQRVIWFMNGPVHTGGWDLGFIPTVWNTVGTTDFNADGKPDIVLQNQITGRGAVWLMNGPRPIGTVNEPIMEAWSDLTEWNIKNY
jgi:hypothetical protein